MKIGKANEKRKRGKVKRAKYEEVNGQAGEGGAPGTHGAHIQTTPS